MTEIEKLKKQLLEKINKLDNSQLLELYSNVSKEICRGNTKKSIKEYLVYLMINYKINLFKDNIKE